MRRPIPCFYLLYTILMALSFSVCNGNAAENTSTPSSALSQPLGTVTIDYYGDSTIWGYKSGVGSRVAVPAPAAFQAALSKYKPSIKYVVNNEGVAGSTACRLLNGSDGRHPKWTIQMKNSRAAFVIINHAINDVFQESVSDYSYCLTELVQHAKAYGKTVIFETPNPTKFSRLGTYVVAMKNVASQQRVAVIDQYSYLIGYLHGASVYQLCPDGIHPSEYGYKMKGQYAARRFVRLYP